MGLVAYVCVVISQLHWRPVLVDAYSPPRLLLPQEEVDLGIVLMDSISEHGVPLQNVGGGILILKEVVPSCGCTAVTPKEKTLLPGKTTYLTVGLDASLKLGAITKTVDIYTNDAKEPHQVLTLKAHAIAPEKSKTHDGMLKVKDPLVLFKGDCASCHVERGIGKMGEELYLADCGMCHGMQAEGAVAPKLNNIDMSNPMTRQYIEEVIRNGSKLNPSMPPYAKAKGGPLDDAQIESLLNYLTYLSSQNKNPATAK
jgi:mono/diheme cytochrome c family protein